MWTKLAAWLKDIFFGVLPEPAPEVIPEYSVPETWIFEGDKPSNDAIHTLYKGFETAGDHIMFRSPSSGRFAGSFQVDNRLWLTRELTYWIAEGSLLPGHQYLSIKSTCGVQRCIRPDHLKVKYAPSKKEKAPKPLPKVKPNKVKGPPEYIPPTKPKLTGKSKDELLSGDRTKCISSKVFFPNLVEVQAVAAYYNQHYREMGERRLYGYDCDWCAGAHLTKQNPKTRPEYKHKGSWA